MRCRSNRGNRGRWSGAVRGGAMAGEQRTSPEFTGTALEATVRLGDGMGRKREAR